MKRKVAAKSTSLAKRKSSTDTVAAQGLAKQFRKYLSKKFTRQLSRQMHRAKQAALAGKE